MKKEFSILLAGDNSFRSYSLLESVLDNLISSKVKAGFYVYFICEEGTTMFDMAHRYSRERFFSVYPLDAETLDTCEGGILFWDEKSEYGRTFTETCKIIGLNLKTIRYEEVL